MKALSYLLCTRLKNMVLSLFKKPAQLIMALFLIAMIVLSVGSAAFGGTEAETYSDKAILYAIVFVFYAMMFVLGISAGFKNGATFFSMADVNFLFNAPFASKSILIYGMIRQLGTSILMGFFILFQYGWMHNGYGITLPQLLVIWVGYGIVLFCSQLAAMFIYARTSHNEKRQAFFKRMIYAVFIVLGAYLVLPLLNYDFAANGIDGVWMVLAHSFNRIPVNYIPVVGWLRAAITGVVAGDWLLLGIGLGATALFIVLFIMLLMKIDADYFEDVLSATEVSFSAITAKKEGRMGEIAPQNVKVGAEGINKGSGASVFFFKHKLESRRARKIIFDTMTLVVIVVSLVFSYIMRQFSASILVGVGFSVYMMFFASFTGRWLKELLFPYIYLIPEKPFKKLMMVIGETLQKNALIALIVGIGVGLIVGAPPTEIFAAVLLHFGASSLLVAANLLTDRLFGGLMIKWVQVIIYLLVMVITALPGIIAGVVVGMIAAPAAGMVVAAAWLIGVSIIVAFFSRNILTWAELNNN